MRRRRRLDATLVFDGDCAFCTRCVGWLDRWVPVELEVVPWQWADLAALGVTQAEAQDAVQLVEADGRRTSGAVAVARLLSRAGGVWAAAGSAMRIWPISRLADTVYRWVARHRDLMPGGTPACALPQAQRDLRNDEGPAA